MNRIVTAVIVGVVYIVFPPKLMGDSLNFADTSSEIIEKLTKQKKSGIRARNLSKKTDMNDRGLKRLRKEEGKVIEEGVSAQTAKENSSVNLAILFANDSADILVQSSETLRELADAIQSEELSNKKFIIVGHTDSVGSEQYNLDLSLRRAESVRRYLTEEYQLSASAFAIEDLGQECCIVGICIIGIHDSVASSK